LSADAVLFNSHYHQQSFLTALPEFLKKFPDHNELQSVEQIRAKSCVLHLGQELKRFDDYRPTDATAESQRPPLILWNHRWEYDKNPQAFFEALYQLQDEGLNFEVALLGESFRNGSAVFDQARERLGERVVQFGYAESFADYARWLWRADLLPVTSDHDFFGGSVVQAIYCGCTPLLPRRLAYPEHLPPELAESCLFDDYNELTMQLRSLLQGAKRPDAAQLRAHVSRYDWQELIGQYDDLLEGLVG
ncbi:MAG: DUF3524 domain-containing protein, partial [Desulfuromonadales bacterium]|nr:DUF3524 domain-containing protein [Desulfuromonadales bacterium]